MVLLVYSLLLGLQVYLMKVLLLYAVAQDQGSFVSRDGETTLNYPGGLQALLPRPVAIFKNVMSNYNIATC